jgi:hypothetical protein
MAANQAEPGGGRGVTAIFHDANTFTKALGALLKAGFDRAAISVLADHDAVKDHFGRIPDADEMADRSDTPREDLDTEGALHRAIQFIAETAAIIGEIGVAGAAFAVGGPVGVASGAATATDMSLNDVFTHYIDRQYHDRFEESVRDGGVVCWVHVRGDKEHDTATATLKASGGEHVHTVDLSG